MKAELQQARRTRPKGAHYFCLLLRPHMLTRPSPFPPGAPQLEQKTAFAASLQQKPETATAAAPPAAGGGGASAGGSGGGGGGFSLVQVLLVAALALFVGRLNVGIGGSPPPPPPAKAAASESLPTGLPTSSPQLGRVRRRLESAHGTAVCISVAVRRKFSNRIAAQSRACNRGKRC